MMNIHLRAVVDEDLDAFLAFGSDPVAVHMAAFTSEDPTDRTSFEAQWTRIHDDDSVWIRTIAADGVVVGSVLRYVQDGEREVSYWLGRDHWGRGIASSALAMYLDEFAARPLFARVALDNSRSIRALETCGFTVMEQMRGYANARRAEIPELRMVLR